MENEEINFMFSDIFDFENYFNENTENLNETSSLAEETTATVSAATKVSVTLLSITETNQTYGRASETISAGIQSSTATAAKTATATTMKRQFRDVNIDNFLNENENMNTKKKTVSDMKLFNQFLLHKQDSRNVENIPAHDLNNLICEFLLGVTKKDGSEYEPTTLRGIIGSIDRYLKHNNSNISLMNDKEFAKVWEVMKSKQKALKKQGYGNKPREAVALTKEHIEAMYSAQTLGDSSPRALIHSLWIICTTHFGMRTGNEIHKLCWGDVTLGVDFESGEEYITRDTERQTKTRTGENPRNTR